MTLIGIESLLCLKEAAEDCALSARRKSPGSSPATLSGSWRIAGRRAPPRCPPDPRDGAQAKTKISGGTGLRSKWAELYDPASWPSFYSRCQGSRIWDGDGRGLYRLRRRSGRHRARLLRSGRQPGRAAAGELRFLLPARLAAGDGIGRSPARGCTRGRAKSATPAAAAMPWGWPCASRAATGRSGVAFCGYHGWHDWYLAANLGDSHSTWTDISSPDWLPWVFRGNWPARPCRLNTIAGTASRRLCQSSKAGSPPW